MGRVEEVASLVAFVASPRADYINGSNLRIDGGLDPTWPTLEIKHGHQIADGGTVSWNVGADSA
jgi:hypothetical protein